MSSKASVEAFASGGVKGWLHRPSDEGGETPRRGLVLTHGASGSANAPLLVRIAGAFTDAGFTVLRFDLPYRQKRPKGPPNISAAGADRANIREAAAIMRGMTGGRVCMGGHSYGGRQTSMLAAEDKTCADAVLLLSYPLHPPGKSQFRTGHFPALEIASLFVHGTRDAFGSPEELRTALTLIPARSRLSVVETAGHDLKGGAFDLGAMIVKPLEELLDNGPV